MALLLDLRTIALGYVAIRIGLALVLIYLWSVQRNYPPAREWALGALLTAAGLFLLSLRELVLPVISEILSSFLLLPGWMVFNLGIMRASGQQPSYKVWGGFCALAVFGNYWFINIQPNDPLETLLYHGTLIAFELLAAYSCLINTCCYRRNTFRAIAFLLLVSVATLLLKLAMGVFGFLAPLSDDVPRIIQLFSSMMLFPMLTMLLALQTSQKLQMELNDQARHDMLTGAYNRRAFTELVEQAWERAQRYQQPLCIVSLDIDNFKLFNDNYGHQTGDQALQLVSGVAQATLRSNDIWCRQGGEEFVALLPDTDLMRASACAERLRAAIARAVLPAPNNSLSLSVSIGVAERRPEHTHWSELLARSDVALYRAKAAGKNCVVTD